MAGRGRPKNKAKGEAPTGTTAKAAQAAGMKLVGGTEANSDTILTNQEGGALFISNVAKYERALAIKKKADADFKNACKMFRSDHGDRAIDMIKDAIKLREPAGRAELEADITSKRQVAMWMGLPLGAQGDLFGKDRRTAEERANTAGFQAGAAGEDQKVPAHFGDEATKPGAAWVAGWEAGQRALVDIKTKRGAPLLRAAEEVGPNDGEPEPGGDDEGEGEGEGEDESGPDDEGETDTAQALH